MDLETVIANLENTIQGKRQLLDHIHHYDGGVSQVTREFVQINIAELERILEDLKKINQSELLHMKVKELVELLQTFDPNALVILQRDPEGNGYAPLSGAEAGGAWDNQEREYGYAQLTEALKARGYEQEDCIEGEPAVVLWPRW